MIDMMALLTENELSLLVESMLLGIQHPAHEISNKALETCSVFIDHVAELEEEDVQNAMYKMYYARILHTVLWGVTDHDRRTRKYEECSKNMEIMQLGYI